MSNSFAADISGCYLSLAKRNLRANNEIKAVDNLEIAKNILDEAGWRERDMTEYKDAVKMYNNEVENFKLQGLKAELYTNR